MKRLKAGQGCEAFISSPQGKTLAWITIHERGDDLLIRADPGGLELALPHFARYSVFDEIEIRDDREATFELHFAGEETEAEAVRALALDEAPGVEFSSVLQRLAMGEVTVIRESPLGVPGITVLGPAAGRDAFFSSIGARGDGVGSTRTRSRACASRPGHRDSAWISSPTTFRRRSAATRGQSASRKGATSARRPSARLDALGHVNKILRGLNVQSGEPPQPGTAINASGQPAGTVTSSGRSPRDDRGVALAMVRVKVAPLGSAVAWDGGDGVVVERAAP